MRSSLFIKEASERASKLCASFANCVRCRCPRPSLTDRVKRRAAGYGESNRLAWASSSWMTFSGFDQVCRRYHPNTLQGAAFAPGHC